MEVKQFLIEPEVLRYAYLIKNGNRSILIDPGASSHASLLLDGLKKEIKITDIIAIILQNNDLLNLTSIPDLIDAGFHGKIIAQEGQMPYLEAILNHEVTSIEAIDDQFVVDDQHEFHFITTPFLPYPEGFITYESHSKTLFSAHLCSQDQRSTNENMIERIHRFHEQILPGVEFIRQIIRKLSPYPLNTIYPRLGQPIIGDAIEPIMYGIAHYDFYHTNQVILRRNQKNVTYHYEMICNHMLKRLEAVYSRKQILAVFDKSQITLQLYPSIEIEKTSLIGYKLWHYFFDRIYVKKGITWLAILEPVVRMYQRKYHIQLPSIYRLKTYQHQSQILLLNEQTDELSDKIKELESHIQTTTDHLLRCPITGLYNETFMKEYIHSTLSNQSKEKLSALILIQVDHLIELNRKYSKIQGDETLKHLSYILSNHATDHIQFFKQNGPGFYMFVEDTKREALLKFILELREDVQQSKVYIEPITISMSIACTDEYYAQNPSTDILTFLMTNTLKRMEVAKQRGVEQLIDKTDNDQTNIEGYILLIDEDETYQNLMVMIFKRIHYLVLIAKDIEEAQTHLSFYSVDIILSEINMSKLDGFQFKHLLNQSKEFRHIPFVMISHLKNQDVIERANELNVDLVLQKPIIPEELIGHVIRMRQKKGAL